MIYRQNKLSYHSKRDGEKEFKDFIYSGRERK